MTDPIRLRASVIVRGAIARHLCAPMSFVLEEHALDDDLGLDGLDLALVGIALAEDAGTSVDFSLPTARACATSSRSPSWRCST